MPCATNSCLWCDFDAVSSGLPPPFSSLLISVARSASAVVGFASCSVLLVFYYSFARHHRSYCFSMSSHRPSSLSGPSPCIYTAGAYCLAEGEGFEPPMFLFAVAFRTRCFRPLSQPSQCVEFLAVFPRGHCCLISRSRPSLMSLLILCFG